MAAVPGNLAPVFQQASAQAHIPVNVLEGVAQVESAMGQDRGPSSAGAVGLMQFEPGTARGLGINPYNDRQAILGAARLLNQYGYQSNPMRALGAYNGGPGNPQYSYAQKVMQAAKLFGDGPAVGGSSGAGFNVPQVKTTTTPGGPDWTTIGVQALLNAADAPISPSGKFHASDLAGSMLHLADTGKYNLPSTTTTSITPSSGSSVLPHGSGDVNPLGHGWTLGRSDMGVDANAPVGTPIRAINDSVVTAILHNWYAGQDLVEMKLTSGPNAGKYWYVAEQIHHNLHVGQVLQRGSTVATYAPSGTGIEIGWGAPSGNGETLAQYQGNTGDAHHNNAPAGLSFRHEILGLP